jgi:hypothetical protein
LYWVHFCQAKIENFGVSTRTDENIGRLNVSVNDAGGVSGVERIGDFNGEREESLCAKDTLCNAIPQSCSLQEFHGDKRLAVLLTDVIDRADVRMVECGGSLGLSTKSRQGLGIRSDVFR